MKTKWRLNESDSDERSNAPFFSASLRLIVNKAITFIISMVIRRDKQTGKTLLCLHIY